MNEIYLKIQKFHYELLFIPVLLLSFSLAYLIKIIISFFLYISPENNVIQNPGFQLRQIQSRSLSQYESLVTGNLIRGLDQQIMPDNQPSVPAGGEDMTVTGILSGHWSFARVTILEKGESETVEYAIGNTIHGFKIKNIFPHYVLFVKGGQKFKVGIGETPGQNAEASNMTIGSSSETFKKILSRTDLDKQLSDPTALYKDARFGPEINNGKIEGYKIYHISNEHIFYSLGARNEDLVKRVNGMPLNKTEKMLEIWNSVKTADRITIDIERQGKILTYEFIVRN